MFMRLAVLIFASALIAGCGGGGGDSSTADKPASSTPATSTAGSGGGTPGGDKGIGPINTFDVAAIDMSLAATGKENFTAKCTACHKIEERYIGPALMGITKRRKPEWILNMILNPDVMVKEDETAKALLAEYLAPMTNQNLTEEEAVSILAYFLESDKGQ